MRVLQKRLEQWIDQGLIKLYQSSKQELPILCFNTNGTNRKAIALNKSDDSYEWFQTTSAEGVETVFNNLKTIRASAKIITAEQLAQPDTQIIFLQPSRNKLTLQQLRQKLDLEAILTQSKIKQATYSDRYLQAPEAKILADLIQISCDHHTEIAIRVLENANEQSASKRKKELEVALEVINNRKASYRVIVQPQHVRKHFKHSRILHIQRQDGIEYKIIFDLGLDFLELERNRVYSITKPSYIVIIKL